MRLRVLGPVTIETNEGALQPGTPRQRAVLGLLGLRAGETVPLDRLIELLWGDAPPPTATKTVQAYLSRLRGATGLGLPAEGVGYRLDLPRDEVDAAVMADELAAARAAVAAQRLDAAHVHFAAALSLWRSAPFAELADSALAQAEAAHQLEAYLSGTEDHHECRLALGHHVELVADLERFCTANPTRERSWGHLMLALYRAGRQADALRAYQRAREVLGQELGIDPGPELVELEAKILRQESELDGPRGAEPALSPVERPPVDAAGMVERVRPVITVCGLAPTRVLGRDAELADLDTWFDAGTGVRMRIVTGEPGIGKTTLVDEFCRRLDGRAVALRGRSSPGLAMSYQPMIECAQDLLGRPSDEDETRWLAGPDGAFLTYLMPELEPVLGVPPIIHRDVVEQRVVATAFDMIGRAGLVAPVMMVMDDLMWTSENTLAVLRHAMTSQALGELRLLVTQRPGTVGGPTYERARAELVALGASEMELTGLPPTAVAELFDESSEAEVAQLVDVTHGHPLFLTELHRAGRRTFTTDEEVPNEIVETVKRWVEVIEPQHREVLARFAVITAPVDDAGTAAILGLEPDLVLDVLDDAEGVGLVRQQADGTTVFSHEVVRRALAQTVSPRRRARVESAVDAYLES